jgi:glycosyltransferase involved in cell wall biosynthesis
MKSVCFFGIYDPDYSRNRVLMEGFRQNGYRVVECRVDPRSHRGLRKYFELYRRQRRMRGERFEHVVVAFPGQTVVWLARLLFGGPIIFDAFLSLYDSNVLDRKLHRPFGLGLLDWWWDYSSCTLARTILLDTQQHIEYFARMFAVPRAKMVRVWVGSDPAVFAPRQEPVECDVHFHGTYIPLQGISYIIEAARLLQNDRVRFRIVGAGQESKKIAQLAAGLSNVEFVGAVPYEALPALIASSRVCLGVFGKTPKARRVIPNKVYECLAMGKPIITADTPAVRELAAYGEVPMVLVAPADAGALAAAIRTLLGDPQRCVALSDAAVRFWTAHFLPQELVGELLRRLGGVLRA